MVAQRTPVHSFDLPGLVQIRKCGVHAPCVWMSRRQGLTKTMTRGNTTLDLPTASTNG